MPSIKKQKNKKQQTKNTYFGTLFKNGYGYKPQNHSQLFCAKGHCLKISKE